MRWCDGDTREEPRSDEQGRKRATGEVGHLDWAGGQLACQLGQGPARAGGSFLFYFILFYFFYFYLFFPVLF